MILRLGMMLCRRSRRSRLPRCSAFPSRSGPGLNDLSCSRTIWFAFHVIPYRMRRFAESGCPASSQMQIVPSLCLHSSQSLSEDTWTSYLHCACPLASPLTVYIDLLPSLCLCFSQSSGDRRRRTAGSCQSRHLASVMPCTNSDG